MQQKKAKSLSAEDFGLEDDEEQLTLEVRNSISIQRPFDDLFLSFVVGCAFIWITLQEILAQGKSGVTVSADGEAKNETGTAYEEVQKDFNALTKEEQMDVVYR